MASKMFWNLALTMRRAAFHSCIFTDSGVPHIIPQTSIETYGRVS